MAKSVFTTQEIPHVWANIDNYEIDSARNNQGSLTVRDQYELFSYSLKIGQIVEIRKDEKAALVLEINSSPTTNRHISDACRALSGMHIFFVPSLPSQRPAWTWNPATNNYDMNDVTYKKGLNVDHKTNLKSYKERISESVVKALRSRKYGDYHLRIAERLASQGNRYAEYFRLKTRFDVPDSEGVKALMERQAENLKLEAAERRATIARGMVQFEKTTLPCWRRDGGRIYPPNGKIYLRIAHHDANEVGIDFDEVVTSAGARVPVPHAKRVARIVSAIKSGETQPFKTNGNSIKIGNYQISSINSKGTLKAGCHTILWPEIERIGVALGAL